MVRPMAATLIKKYGNRRLYDTGESRYITLEELSDKIRAGDDVRVVDAKSNEDLTQATLTQIIIESRGAARLLPPQLLMQLIRLGDDALAEFFGRWVTGALDVYMQARRGAQQVATYNPFAAMPFGAGDALARMWMNNPFGPAAASPPPPAPPPPPAEPEDEPASADDVAALRREIEELKRSFRGRPRQKPARR